MKKEYLGLIIVLGIVLVALGSFVSYNQWPLLTGQKTILATQPVDPFDPLRGQYMIINYEISRINKTSNMETGDTIYIMLEEDTEGISRLKDTLSQKPTTGDFIKGTVTNIYGDTARVEYGIEQYFFERHADLPTRNITVEVKIADSGRSKIVQLLHNGEPVKIEYEEFDIRA